MDKDAHTLKNIWIFFDLFFRWQLSEGKIFEKKEKLESNACSTKIVQKFVHFWTKSWGKNPDHLILANDQAAKRWEVSSKKEPLENWLKWTSQKFLAIFEPSFREIELTLRRSEPFILIYT